MSQEVEYTIPAVHCGHCVHTIKLEVGDLAGVEEVQVDEESKRARVRFAPPASEDQIIALLKEINYPPEGHDLLQVN